MEEKISLVQEPRLKKGQVKKDLKTLGTGTGTGKQVLYMFLQPTSFLLIFFKTKKDAKNVVTRTSISWKKKKSSTARLIRYPLLVSLLFIALRSSAYCSYLLSSQQQTKNSWPLRRERVRGNGRAVLVFFIVLPFSCYARSETNRTMSSE